MNLWSFQKLFISMYTNVVKIVFLYTREKSLQTCINEMFHKDAHVLELIEVFFVVIFPDAMISWNYI